MKTEVVWHTFRGHDGEIPAERKVLPCTNAPVYLYFLLELFG